MNPTFLSLLVVALANTAVIDLARTLLWNTAWRTRKPLSCDTCMAWWFGLGSGLFFQQPSPRELDHVLWWLLWAATLAGMAILLLAMQRFLRNDAVPPFPG